MSLAYPSASFDYPLVMNLKARLVVIVGAGSVGQRKMAGLLHSGAHVKLIDPGLMGPALDTVGGEAVVRDYRSGDLAGAALVFACTDRPEVNRAVVAEARQRAIFCCCSDQSIAADFSLPAVVRRGSLLVAVSTGGGSPALAVHLRDQLAEQLPVSWGLGVEIIAAVRRKWLTEKPPSQYDQQVLRKFWEEQLIPGLDCGNTEAIDRLLIESFGENYSLAHLQIQLPEGLP